MYMCMYMYMYMYVGKSFAHFVPLFGLRARVATLREKFKPKSNFVQHKVWEFTHEKNLYKSGARVRFSARIFSIVGGG